MQFCVLYLFCFLIATTLARPSKVQEDGITSSDEDDVFIMRKSDLRNDWCKTRPFKQTIKIPGCLPVQVMNNFCYGQCNSLYIPNHASQQPLFESCTSCLPQRSFMKTFTLHCPSLPVKFQKHRYLHSKKCRCTSVQRWTSECEPKPDGSWRSSKFKIAWRQMRPTSEHKNWELYVRGTQTDLSVLYQDTITFSWIRIRRYQLYIVTKKRPRTIIYISYFKHFAFGVNI